jgi:hypothetical protein
MYNVALEEYNTALKNQQILYQKANTGDVQDSAVTPQKEINAVSKPCEKEKINQAVT